jgi:hypothetical protein
MMMQLMIQGLRKEYEAIDKALDLAFDSDYCKKETMEDAYCALHEMLRTLILSSSSYNGMTNAAEIESQCARDMYYVTTEYIPEQEKKVCEEWHWKRIEEQEKLKKKQNGNG